MESEFFTGRDQCLADSFAVGETLPYSFEP